MLCEGVTYCNWVSSINWVLLINVCIAICCCVAMFVYKSSQLRGKCMCLPGSACYNKISCDFTHEVTHTKIGTYREGDDEEEE